MTESRKKKDSPEGPWTVSLVKDLLHERFWKFEKGLWPAWFAEHGGFEGVLEFIRSCAIPAQLHEILKEILQNPGENRAYYAAKLNIHRATASDYFTKLAGLLATQLNQWSVEVAPSVSDHHHLFPSTIPAAPNACIGREEEINTLCTLLQQPGIRLLTLTGPGGIGKTRLALEVARATLDAFPDGVFFIPLAAITDPHLVLSIILQTLDLKEAGEQSAQETLLRWLQRKNLLLVLDNFEQVLAASPLVANVLAMALRVKVIVTSRALLQLYGEQEYVVPTLSVPVAGDALPPETLTTFSAIALFIDRARAANLRFQLTEENAPAVRTICAQLDGLPLALELAAGHCKYFSPQALFEQLRESLSLLTAPTRDRPARHQTLQATIAWSYDLLSPAEQTLFARLAVFVGGWTAEAAATVCNANSDLAPDVFACLVALTDKSLLQQHLGVNGKPRFRMLETIHKYALQQLAARGELPMYQQRHAECFLTLAECAEPKLTSPESIRWLNQLEEEHDNLRQALRWALDEQRWDIALRLGGSLREFWYARGYFREGRQWLAQALQRAASVPDQIAAKAIYAAGILAMAQGDNVNATALFERARTMYQILGQDQGIASSLSSLGAVCMSMGDFGRATELYQQALWLFQTLNDARNIEGMIHNLGVIAFLRQDYTAARQHFEKGLELARRLNIPQSLVMTLTSLGSIAYWEQDYIGAIRVYQESLELNEQLSDEDCLVVCLEGLGFVALDVRDVEIAAHVLGGIETYRERLGLPEANEPIHTLLIQKIEEARKKYLDRWDAWWSAGQAMTKEQLVEYVRGWVMTMVSKGDGYVSV